MDDAAEPAKVAIVVVSFNALRYARRMLRSVRTTTGVPYDVIVVDNASGIPARLYWIVQRLLGRITRLALLDRNTFFAEGCNIGVALAPRDATHVLLLNTDCEVRDPRWLERMLTVHQQGATALGFIKVGPWPRADGFCLLVDRRCWEDGLDETYQWWWSVTGLQARLLRQGRTVTAVRRHTDIAVHHGGKSGTAYTAAHSGDTRAEVIAGWFEGHEVTVLDRLPEPAGR